MARIAVIPDRPREAYQIHEVAGLLGCSENLVYKAIAAGELDTIDIRAKGAQRPKTRVTQSALDAYLERKSGGR